MVLSRGARALEQTAAELERTAGELRSSDRQGRRENADEVWSEPPRDADTMTRSAPLRAVPTAPTDEAPGADAERHVPPVRPPQTPDRPRPGRIDARVVTAAESPDLGVDAETDPLRALATGTVSEIRARLDDLSAEELRSLREVEVHNRNRTTLLTAIDKALELHG